MVFIKRQALARRQTQLLLQQGGYEDGPGGYRHSEATGAAEEFIT